MNLLRHKNMKMKINPTRMNEKKKKTTRDAVLMTFIEQQ